jgi:hypothetical protein
LAEFFLSQDLPPVVIAREKRAIQYSEASVMESKNRDVLDSRIGHRRKHLCLDKPRRSVQIHHRVVSSMKDMGAP